MERNAMSQIHICELAAAVASKARNFSDLGVEVKCNQRKKELEN